MQMHGVRSLDFSVVCTHLFDIWPAPGANEQRSIQQEFGLEAESLPPIGYHLANAGRLHNIWTGGDTHRCSTVLDPVQQLCDICQAVFFDVPVRVAYLAIAAPLPGTDCDAAVVETGERGSQSLLERGCIVALAHDQLEA